ncbi:helix-turn-helix domain-containing protein [Kiritimatiellaeota bacterium B1221]|nr:helix-turn-helix domain-containing protein [Kiritimatiellaeota bacterium B1221]
MRKYNWKTGCDVEATLSVIGGRWKPVLLCHLLGGQKRFGELRRLTPHATERMITLQLRELEADGVIHRHVFAEVPPRVEYEITEFGRTLAPILEQMQKWGNGFKIRKFAEEEKSQQDVSGEKEDLAHSGSKMGAADFGS